MRCDEHSEGETEGGRERAGVEKCRRFTTDLPFQRVFEPHLA